MLEKKFSILSWEIKGSLNLNLTMRSEQYTNSNWKRMNGKYRKIVRLNGNLFGLEVWQEGSVEKPEVYVKVYSKRHVDEKIVEDFRLRILRELGLNYDLDVVYEKLEKDEVARKLVNQFFGLRLVRYINPEECLLTYQLSTNTTIKRLEQMSEPTVVFDPFTGPIMDQNHKTRIPEGVRASHDTLWMIDWFVDNVVGTIP